MKKRSTAMPDAVPLEGRLQGFQALFEEHWPHVYRAVCRLVGDPDEAQDLALEAFVRLYQRYPLPASDFNPGGWLYRVATNLGLHSIRSHNRRAQYELAAGRDALNDAPEDRPAVLLDRQEEHRLARQALAQMNERQSQLLILRYSGTAYKEIAEILGLSPTSIGPLLFRAEREFEKCYRALVEDE